MGKLSGGKRSGIITAVAVAWTKKRTPLPGTIIKSFYVPGTVPQKKQWLKLARAAHGKYGTTGKVGGVPRIAVELAPLLTGSVGGMSREEVRTAKHSAASATISRLEAEIAGR